MNRSQLVLFLLLISLMVMVAPTVARPNTPTISSESQASNTRHANGVMFIENVGQFDDEVRFQVLAGGNMLWLTENALWFTVMEPEANSEHAQSRDLLRSEEKSKEKSRRGVNIRVSFEGANPRAQLDASARMDTTVSYFREKNPEGWRENVPVWGSVRYVDLYPGLDLEIDDEGRPKVICRIQCETVLQEVTLRVDGASALRLEEDLIHITTGIGDYSLPLLPVVTTEENSSVNSFPRPLLHNNVLSFPFATSERRSVVESTEIIEGNPGDLLYSTFLGGNAWDTIRDVTVDEAGSAYVTGESASLDFPTTPGAFETSQNGDFDAFIVKINPEGNALSYATFLGGESGDYGSGISVDEAGNAYVTGNTNSLNFPTTASAFDTTHNGMSDIYVVKVNQNGSALAYSTLLGGNESEYGIDLAIDGAGRAYVTGETRSENYPTTSGALDTTYNGGPFGGDAFAARIDNSGSSLDFSTYIGGSEWDIGYGIALDNLGSVYIAGWTWSGDFPVTSGAVDTILGGGEDAFVTKLAPNGDALTYATFLGGSGPDGGADVAVDDFGNAFVTGWTSSGDFPTTPDALDTSYDNGDAFIATLDSGGSFLAYATFLGGSGDDSGVSVDIAGADNVYVAGSTQSEDFPTTSGALQMNYNGSGDAFLVNLDVAGSDLSYGTYLGGDSADGGGNIVIDEAGFIFIAGGTQSGNFPTTPGAFDDRYNGDWDGFVAKFSTAENAETYTISGRVIDQNNSPLPGVALSTNAGHKVNSHTDGSYVITGVITGTYIVTPNLTGFAFTPTSRTVMVPPDASDMDFSAEPVTRLTISHIEVTQVIQDEGNDITLIAEKPAFVRVYVDCGEGCEGVEGVTGTLEVTSSAGTALLQPDMGAIRAEHPPTPPGWSSQRGDLRKTLNYYRIPTDLLTDEVTFTARVGDVTLSETATFVPGQNLRIAWVPINFRPAGPLSPTYRPATSLTNSATRFMREVYPLAPDSLLYYHQPNELTIDWTYLTGASAANTYLPRLDQLFQAIEDDGGWLHERPDRLFGWIAARAFDGGSFGYASSRWWPTGTGRVAVGIATPYWVDGLTYDVGFAHEIGHLLSNTGLKHAPCGEADDTDPNIPGGRIDDWGVDFLGQPPRVWSPAFQNVAYDFMSYCAPAWISKYHYRQLINGFTQFAPEAPQLAPTDSQPVLSVIATIITPTNEVIFDSFLPLDGNLLPDASTGTDYCFELRDSNEVTLDTRCFDLGFVAPETGEVLDRQTVSLALPYPVETEAVVLTHQGTELERVVKSENAPTVQLLSPNGGESWSATETYTVTWTSDDRDGDSLRFMVSYSIDDGTIWIPLAINVIDHHLAIDSSQLPGTTQARFRVTAVDQLLKGEDTSDNSFTVARKAPSIHILSPQQSATVPPGLPLIFQGYGYDNEDGPLDETALHWSSSIDGDLGTGGMIFVDLSPGEHTITLQATDNDDITGSSSIQVTSGYHLHLPVVLRP